MIDEIMNLPNPADLPPALRGLISDEIATYGRKHLKWSRISTGMQQMRLRPARSGGSVRFIRAKGGARAPLHGHPGLEFTYVVSGGYSDEDGDYVKGDLSVADDSHDHRPVADPEGCVLAWASDGPVRLPGLLGLILNPLIK
jgi:putative transcriptional regulator